MVAYAVRRMLAGVLVVFGVLTLVFFSLHLAPGDPVDMLLPADSVGQSAHALADQLRARYGLDKPISVQYMRYLERVFALDLGRSIRTDRPVASDLIRYYPATIELTVSSLLLAGLVGIMAGVISAVKRNSLLDNVSMTVALLGVSMPGFVLGLLLMLVFALELGWLPPSGRAGGFWSWDALKFLILPACTLGFAAAGLLARLVRSAMLDVLQEDYIRTARAKGLSERIVNYRHALKNALIPVVTVFGLQFGHLLAGAVIAETVFSWPGVGRYIILAITGKDFPAVQGAVMLIAVSFVMVNILVDILYGLIDPRISYR